MSLEKTLSRSSFLKYSTFIDIFDAISGPLCFLMYSSGSEHLHQAANILSGIELGLVKAPFVFSYISKTKDWKSLLYWAPKEFVSNYVPVASVIDIIPAYRARVKYKESINSI